MAVLPIAIRVLALRFAPFPSPGIRDEFSYLLAADTFASGRLTNPPHPMWVRFETFHEIFQPTYASEFPPGQSLFMAFGQRFLGHPWFGVCISFGLMCGCLCWMLQGFLPPVYALWGTLVAMAEFSLVGYWMDSYWGGAVAAMGGSLVLGAVPRLAKSTSASASWTASLGLMILALSRPFEALVVTFAAVAGLLWWRHRLGRRLLDLFAPQGLVIVRYAADHNPLREFVFNRADIDYSFIIWARDMGYAKNRELIDYYPHRRVWLLEPDSPPLKVTPYPKQPFADARGSVEPLTLRKGSRT
jgi:hypothetical protein